MEGIAKNDLSWKSFLMNFGIDLFGSLGDRFSDFLGLENRLENRGIFGDVTNPEFWIWGW